MYQYETKAYDKLPLGNQLIKSIKSTEGFKKRGPGYGTGPLLIIKIWCKVIIYPPQRD